MHGTVQTRCVSVRITMMSWGTTPAGTASVLDRSVTKMKSSVDPARGIEEGLCDACRLTCWNRFLASHAVRFLAVSQVLVATTARGLT